MNYEAEYWGIVQACADQGAALMRNLANEARAQPLYLYCRPSTATQSGKLFLAREDAPVPEGVHLVTGEPLRTIVPYSGYFDWVWQRGRRSPVLAHGIQTKEGA